MRSERRPTVDEIKSKFTLFFHIFNRVNRRFNFEMSFYFTQFFLEFIAKRAQEKEFNTHRSAPRSVYAFRKTKPKPKLDRCVNYCFCSHEFCLVFNRNEKKWVANWKRTQFWIFDWLSSSMWYTKCVADLVKAHGVSLYEWVWWCMCAYS